MIKKIFSSFTRIINLLAILIIAFISLFLVIKNRSNLFIDRSSTAVIHEISKLNRLETASYTIEKIIEAGTQGNAFEQILFGDQILLIAHGEVIAGIDLSQLSVDDISIEKNTITLNLPPAEVFFTNIDENKTRVYDRSQGLLTKGNKDLESEARLAAQQEIEAAALEDGILNKATENAQSQLEALLSSFGFTSITINSK